MAEQYEAVTEAEWKTLATTEITHLTDEEKDYLPRAWDEWIARVRRDAAREALDGLAAELMEAARDCASDGDHSGAGAWRNASAHTYHHRDTRYPVPATPLRAALDS